MATVDLSTMPIKTANEVIRGYDATHNDIEIINPDAKHYIAVGLTNPVNVSIHGSAGYFCGGLSDGPTISIKNNVSWGVGDNMLSGTIIVGGNAGAIAGEALCGGDIIIKGNMGSRAGQVMKKGTLCCVGNSNFMTGYMMYGGRIIILGNAGERVGQNMAGGEIYVGGTIKSLGADAMVCTPSDYEIESVMLFLDRFKISFSGRLQKIVCRGKNLKYRRSEPLFKNIPFTKFSGTNTPWWNEKVQEDINVKSKIGRYRTRGYGTSSHVPNFNDIAFKNDINLNIIKETTKGQCDKTLINTDRTDTNIINIDFLSQINMRTLIGDRNGAKAIDLSMPVMIAPMSIESLSPRVKIALAIASRLSGICENTGGGGMHSVERAEARQLIAQCLSGRFGWNIHDMKRSDALELYISQGAKPGLGGQHIAAKLTDAITKKRYTPNGMNLCSPSRHPDILGGDDLIMKILEFREAVGWRLPVSLKIGGGRTRDDVKIAYKDGIDFIELDGLQGGAGIGSNDVIEYVGIPTISAIMEAMDGLDEIDANGKLPIVLMGGIQNGVDAAKAIALGATAVGVGTSMLIAAGCTGCMKCRAGKCPVGLTATTPKYVERFNIKQSSMEMHSYLESFRFQLAAITYALGHSSVHELCRDDLVALTPEASALTRLPYAPEYAMESSLKIKTSKNQRSYKKKRRGTFQDHYRDIIQNMTHTHVKDIDSQQRIMEMALQGRPNPFPADRPANLDDVVFLSAALTRLVIDPYSEECRTKTLITRTIEIGGKDTDAPSVPMELPFFFTGFDDAPMHVKYALDDAIARCGCGYIGRTQLIAPESRINFPGIYNDNYLTGTTDKNSPSLSSDNRKKIWFQLITQEDIPSPHADALIYVANDSSTLETINAKRLHPYQLLGICADRITLPTVLPHALNNRFDILIIDTTSGITKPWVELESSFDLTVIRDAILRLKSMNMEEEICLINFGGLRSGTDVAKSLALNCNASVFGVAMAIALGGRVNGDSIEFTDSAVFKSIDNTAELFDESKFKKGTVQGSMLNRNQLYNAAINWIKGTAQETAIISKCAGKTNIHNLEPEDMRSISIATSEALGIALTSGALKRNRF